MNFSIVILLEYMDDRIYPSRKKAILFNSSRYILSRYRETVLHPSFSLRSGAGLQRVPDIRHTGRRDPLIFDEPSFLKAALRRPGHIVQEPPLTDPPTAAPMAGMVCRILRSVILMPNCPLNFSRLINTASLLNCRWTAFS